MGDHEGHYGSVPPSRRRLLVVALLSLVVLIVGAGLVINLITGTSVRWGWLLVAVGFAGGMYALYLWIRLSD